MKPYVIGISILLLGLAFWYHGNSNYQSGVNAERVRWQDLLLEDIKRRSKVEVEIQKERVVWKTRVETIEKVVDNCIIPPDILRVLADAGIYIGPL